MRSSVPRAVANGQLSYQYQGIIHVHSNFSDGRGSTQKIMKAANQCHLDFLILTDHNHLQGGEEGYCGKCLLLVGEEITPEDKGNHYLALGISQPVNPHGKTPQQFIDEVNHQGGFGMIAHPYSRPNPSLGSPGYPWVDWIVKGFTGLCIWNYILDGDVGITKWNLLYYLLFPRSYVDRPRPETLRRWDDLNQKGKAVGIGGSDSHGILISHRVCFRFIRTHVILPEPLNLELGHDKDLIYSAMRRGNCFVANDFAKNGHGFTFVARHGTKKYMMGESLPLSGTDALEAESPEEAEILLIRNGEEVASSWGKELRYKPHEPGVYRVEAFIVHRGTRRPWVLTNPIYLMS